jgi:hypothetical protein
MRFCSTEMRQDEVREVVWEAVDSRTDLPTRCLYFY